MESVFSKLSSRSPKDSTMCEAHALRLACDELLNAQSAGVCITTNVIYTAVVRSGISALRCNSAADVIEAFVTSERVCEDDLPLALSFGKEWSQHIVLRQFEVIKPEFEIRAFVFGGKLTAASQYFSLVHLPLLVANKDAVEGCGGANDC